MFIDVTMNDSEQMNQGHCCCDAQGIREIVVELFAILLQQFVAWIQRRARAP